MAVSKVILNGTTLMDVTQKTVTAGTMLSGTTALKKDGTDITGSIATKTSSDLTASGATVTVPAGYYASQASKSVTTMTLPTSTSSSVTSGYSSKATVSRSTSDQYINIAPGYNSAGGYYKISAVANGSATAPASISGSSASVSTGTNTITLSKTVSATPTVSAGYISSGTAGNSSVSLTASVTTKAAATITPTTTDQTIASGTYLTGAQTIKGDSNLVAENIVSGKTIFGVAGSATTGGGGSDVTVEALTVTQNGTYTAPSGKAYSPVTVNVVSSGSSGSTNVYQDENGYIVLDPDGLPTASEKQINFIDYDGTIRYSYTKSEFAQLSTLPANPSHSGLVAQGWNWTLAEIQAQLTAMPDAPVWVGQMYITASGDTEIDITLTDSNFLSPYLTIAVNGTVVVDWGDNTATNTITGTSNSTLVYTQHVYGQTGSYTISISVSSGSFTFYGATNYASVLRVVNVADNRARSRTYAGAITQIRIGNNAYIGYYAFSDCCAMTSITIPNSITSIGTYAFQDCSALTNITIPDEVTNISNYAFQSCFALTSTTIPNGATSIGISTFNNCYALKNIALPNSVTIISNNAFQSCFTLTSLIIPNSVTSFGTNVFQYCYDLTNTTISDSITSISNSTFPFCYALTNITIPDGVTSIGTEAFYGCYALTSVTIPNSVTNISSSAFSGCYNMKEYHLLPTTPPTLANTNVFTGIMSGTIIYVPSSAVNAYKTATNWSTYADYIQGE